MARENSGSGYDRIAGALANLGYSVSDETVAKVLRRHGIAPAPFPEPSRPFLLHHSAETLARMVGCSDHSEAGYRDQMASGGFSAVLALAISVLRRPAEC
jgi:hypothetical protein